MHDSASRGDPFFGSTQVMWIGALDGLRARAPVPLPAADLGPGIAGLTVRGHTDEQRERVLGAALRDLRLELLGLAAQRLLAFALLLFVLARAALVRPAVLGHARAVLRLHPGIDRRGVQDRVADRLSLLQGVTLAPGIARHVGVLDVQPATVAQATQTTSARFRMEVSRTGDRRPGSQQGSARRARANAVSARAAICREWGRARRHNSGRDIDTGRGNIRSLDPREDLIETKVRDPHPHPITHHEDLAARGAFSTSSKYSMTTEFEV